jgi:hypothetical protein
VSNLSLLEDTNVSEDTESVTDDFEQMSTDSSTDSSIPTENVIESARKKTESVKTTEIPSTQSSTDSTISEDIEVEDEGR